VLDADRQELVLAHQNLEETMSTTQICSAEGQPGRRNLLHTEAICVLAASVAIIAPLSLVSPAHAQAEAGGSRPNIVIIWGDDIGQSNISAYSRGLMGYKTPNIDRLAKEGVMFTDYYAEQSCTAGRASFITGQSGLRTGLTKVGLPGATLGYRRKTRPLPSCSSHLATRPGNSARTILATATSSCPRCMVSTSSTAISTT
jgi:Sulfatase